MLEGKWMVEYPIENAMVGSVPLVQIESNKI